MTDLLQRDLARQLKGLDSRLDTLEDVLRSVVKAENARDEKSPNARKARKMLSIVQRTRSELSA